jgi:hypothetical protein
VLGLRELLRLEHESVRGVQSSVGFSDGCDAARTRVQSLNQDQSGPSFYGKLEVVTREKVLIFSVIKLAIHVNVRLLASLQRAPDGQMADFRDRGPACQARIKFDLRTYAATAIERDHATAAGLEQG